MTNSPAPSVAAAIAASEPCPSDKLEALMLQAEAARELELIIANLEEELKVKKTFLNSLYQKSLPDLMDSAGVDRVGIKAEGNKPAMDFRLRPFYSANIAASWSDERREAAFAYLASVNAEDLIKTQVTASLPKGNLELAKQLVAEASRLKIPTKLSKSVHGNTLSAWLKELCEEHHTFPSATDLEKIGGSIGRVVKPEERKE